MEEVVLHRAKNQWKAEDGKEHGDAHHDQTSEQKIVNWDAVRQELWDKHLQSRTLALVMVCEEWHGTTLTLRQQAGAEPERLLLSRRVGVCQFFLSVHSEEQCFCSPERARSDVLNYSHGVLRLLQRLRCLPPWMGCNSEVREVIGRLVQAPPYGRTCVHEALPFLLILF